MTTDVMAEPARTMTWDLSRKPNTFIVGAPKCGTTAMCDWLSQHPQVFVSNPKEPHHFVHKEMPGKARRFGDAQIYANLFSEAGDQQKVRAEGSVWYLYSQSAIENIRAFDSAAKIVIMLRRPDEMVYSMHNQAVVNFSEDILDFPEAWTTALAGNQRKVWSPLCDEPSKLDYHRIALYAEQLSRVYQSFPSSQVHVIFYDDLKANSRQCFNDVLEFLELDSYEADLRRVNESEVVGNRAIGRWLRKPPPAAMRLSRGIKKVLGLKKLGLRNRLRSVNSRKEARKPISEEIRQEIITVYREDIQKLGDLCHRDLQAWLK